jgi:hypothetical protein
MGTSSFLIEGGFDGAGTIGDMLISPLLYNIRGLSIDPSYAHQCGIRILDDGPLVYLLSFHMAQGIDNKIGVCTLSLRECHRQSADPMLWIEK